MLIIEEDTPIYKTIGLAILFYFLYIFKTNFMLFWSRKKNEEKQTKIVSPPQARTGSTSTDVTYSSQYVYF